MTLDNPVNLPVPSLLGDVRTVPFFGFFQPGF